MQVLWILTSVTTAASYRVVPLPCKSPSMHLACQPPHLKALPSTHSLLFHYFVFLKCPMMMGLAHCGGLSIHFPRSLITNLCKHLCATFLRGHGFQQTYPRATPKACGQTGFSFARNCGASSGHSSSLELLLLPPHL